MTRNTGRGNKSLCENSVEMVINMVKLSSLSIAQASLGAVARPSISNGHRAPSKGSVIAIEAPSVPRVHGSRSQEPQSGPKARSYLIPPCEDRASSYTIHEDKNEAASHYIGSFRENRERENIDELASDYIKRVHENIRNDLTNTSKCSPYMLPSPLPLDKTVK